MTTHISRIEIRFADIDVMGHVNNAVYFSYFEQARIRFFREAVGSEWDWKSQGLVLARNEIDYLVPVLLQDEIHIETVCTHIGTKSLTFTYEIFAQEIDGSRKVKARGKSVLVCFDYFSEQTIPVPESWRSALS